MRYYDFDKLLGETEELGVIRMGDEEHPIVRPLPALAQMRIDDAEADTDMIRETLLSCVPSLEGWIDGASLKELRLLYRILKGKEDSGGDGAPPGNGSTASESPSPVPSPAIAEHTDRTP